MAQTMAPATYMPVWIDLSTSDPAASREFYAKVFGWNVEVNPDPQYGGYALAKVGGKDVAGIGTTMMAEAPTAWSIYLGTSDIADMTARVTVILSESFFMRKALKANGGDLSRRNNA